MNDSPTLLFGTYRLDVQNATLEREGMPVALTPKAFSVLHHLARHAGRLVTKEEFLDVVWPSVFVGDAALKVCIREIRKALGDDPQAPTYIQTAHRRGYRFVAPVALVTSPMPTLRWSTTRRPAPGRCERWALLQSRPGVPVTRYARSGDVSIAYQVLGDGSDRPGVRDGLGVAPRLFWREPSFAASSHGWLVLAPDPVRQARHRALDRVATADLEQRMDDVRAVMEAVGSSARC